MEEKKSVVEELTRIANRNNGLLRPADVVEEARDKSSPLHSRFTWDDTKAASEYRLWQARELIRVSVEYLPHKDGQREIKAFVSLITDREKEAGGYRRLISVLSDKEYREQLLNDALAEMNIFRLKYRELKELAEVFEAMNGINQKAALRKAA